MAVPLIERLLAQCQRCEYGPSVRMKPDPRTDEPRRNQIGLRQKRHVPVPLRENVRMGPFEFPHRDLEFSRQAVQVPAPEHRPEDPVLAPQHEDPASTKPKMS